ncbi:MAG: transposase [Thermodesulfobacteriota bacterium]
MPRRARLDAPGALHHVMIRGIERRAIFRSDKDREDLLDRIEPLLPKTGTACYAWAFLQNHAHFLLRSGPRGIASLMRRLLTGYAVSFNLRHRRHGQLFQNRYKSILCEEDPYLLELVRYIHLNPLRAKIVADLEELGRYPYSGHSALMGKSERSWQDIQYVLGSFGEKVSVARRRYLSYVEAGIGQGRRDDLVGGGLIRSLGGWAEVKGENNRVRDRIKGDERILGRSDFVTEVLAEANEQFELRYRLKTMGYDLERVAKKVAGLYGTNAGEIMTKGRRRRQVEARSLLCYWSVSELGMGVTELARIFGMTPSAVSYAARRGEETAKERKYSLLG